MICRTIVIAGLATFVSTPGFAHHSHAMFDDTRTVTVTGTVRSFDWANPHCWLYLTATNEAGQPVEWSLELGSPAQIARRGWRPKTVVPGDAVTVTVHPLKDGGPIGSLASIALPDGTRIGDANPN
jgi:hypothetical protein